MENEYGPVYEVVGFLNLTPEELERFEPTFRNHFLAKGKASVSGELFKSGSIHINGDRSSGYPDLWLELSSDGRLLVCDMDISKEALLAHLRKFFTVFAKRGIFPVLSLSKILDAANGGKVTYVGSP